MARLDVLDPSLDLSEPVLVEGLPGVGLVGKIAVDHLVEQLDMDHYANVEDCDGLPRVAMYEAGTYDVKSPVRVYAAAEHDLLALQSDIPIPKSAAAEFAGCVTDWLVQEDATPVYLSGLPTDEKATPPEMFGIATGDAASILSEVDVALPSEKGLVSGPTGAMLASAAENDLGSVGLVVQSNERFPDPEAARVVLQDGIQPIAGVEVDLDALVDQASEIQDAKEELAQQLQDAPEERSEAKPLRMYQ